MKKEIFGIGTVSTLMVGMLFGLSAPVSATKDTKAEQSTDLKVTDRRHPDYVRCRNYSVIGSLAKKRRVCMTNKEWVVYIRESSKRTRQMIEDGQARATDELDPRLEIDKFGAP